MTFGLQPLERGLGDLLDVLRPTIQPPLRPVLRIDIEAELGGDHHSVPKGGQGLADQLLVRERAINLGGVEGRRR